MTLEIQLRTAPAQELAADILVVGVPPGPGKAPTLPPWLKAVDDALGGALAKLAAKEEFTGKRDQALSLSTLGRIRRRQDRAARSRRAARDRGRSVRTFAAKAARAANAEKAKTLALACLRGSSASCARSQRGSSSAPTASPGT